MKNRFWLPLLSLIALLIIFISISFGFATLKEFYSYKKNIDNNITLRVDRFFYLSKYQLQKELAKYTAPKPLSDKDSSLKTFRITLKQKDISKLNSNLPKSGKENYIKGYLKVSDSNETYKIKLRYRGDSFLHWYYPQKSLRVKLLKNKVYDKAKVFNLINPPHSFSIIDCLTYEIAKKEGLITPKYEPARVFINGRFMGIYIYLSQVDESLLRAHSKMPGSIYYGDLSPTKDTNLSLPASLFFDESLWQKKAARNAEQKYSREDIKLFIKNIKDTNSTKFLKFANTYLNLDKYNIFLALDTLFGSFHHDYAHNHKLYFDPYIGKLEPIEWDLRYWSNQPHKDNSLYPLQLLISNTPPLEAKRDKVAYNLLKKYPAKKIIKMLEYYKNLILPDLKTDILRDTGKRPKEFPSGIATLFTIDEFKKSIKEYENTITQREKFLYKLYNNTTLSYKIKNNKLYLKINGNSPILMQTKDNNTTLYSSRKKEKIKNLPPYLYGYYRYTPEPAFYEFNKTNINKIKFTNYITNKKITPIKEDFNITKLSNPPKQPQNKTITIDGNITLTKDLIFNKNTTVIIKPGTTFSLYPKVSLFFYGKVIAIGTKDKPIKFIAKYPNKPFGSIVLQGQNTSNSIFNYCYFNNGSVATKNLIRYTAQFNLYDTSNFIVKNSYIGKNYIGDDSMHIAYSKGIVQDTNFSNARSDALDIDISEVNVTNCNFKNAKNDSLDIMTTKLIAKNNYFYNSGDKGISVGEASNATIKNSIFKKNYIGLEIKDNSIVNAINLTFKNSKYLDIHLYRKNKRYKNGGFLKAKNLTFTPTKNIKHDKNSKAIIK